MSFRQDGNEICVKYEQQKLVVKAIRDDIVNIFVPYRTKEHYSKAIDGDKAVATELTAEDVYKRQIRFCIITENLSHCANLGNIGSCLLMENLSRHMRMQIT